MVHGASRGHAGRPAPFEAAGTRSSRPRRRGGARVRSRCRRGSAATLSHALADGELIGLDAAGPAPACGRRRRAGRRAGPRSVTVPGAVAGWEALSERYGGSGSTPARGRDRLRRAGFAVAADDGGRGATAAARPSWAVAEGLGETRARFPTPDAHPAPARREGPPRLGRAVARAICAASWLERSDLARYGRAGSSPARALPRGRGSRAAAADAGHRRAGGAGAARAGSSRRWPTGALRAARPRGRPRAGARRRRRRELLTRHSAPRARRGGRSRRAGGGTVYLCAVDGDGTAVSFIQSLFEQLRLGSRRAGHRDRAPEPRRLLRGRRGRRAGPAAVPHDHPRDAPADGGLRGPSASWAASSGAGAHAARWARRRRARSAGGARPAAFPDRRRADCLEEGLWDRAAELERPGTERSTSDPSASAAGRRSSSRTTALVAAPSRARTATGRHLRTGPEHALTRERVFV